MTDRRSSTSRRTRRLAGFFRSTKATAAIEFAIIAFPFFLFVLGTLQLGVFYFSQSALDNGVLKTAQTLNVGFRTGSTAYTPGASTLKSNIANSSGGLIQNGSGLSVEIQPISNLSSGPVAIVDGLANYGSTNTTLVLRAKANVITFAPGFGSLAIATSSAIVRRQGT